MQIGHGKQGVLVGEYEGARAHDIGEFIEKELIGQELGAANTDQNRVLGYIEPACDNPQWILWFTAKGDAIFHQKRSNTGAVEDAALIVKGQNF